MSKNRVVKDDYEMVTSKYTIRSTDKESLIDPIDVCVDSAADGDFVLLTCGIMAIPIDPENWPYINDAINRMMKDIVQREKE